MLLWRWGWSIALALRAAGAPSPAAHPATSPLSAESLAVAPGQISLQSSRRGDPADSLYRMAVQTLNNDQPLNAVAIFQQLITQYPRSKYVPEAYYWIAFAYYRAGSRDNNLANFRSSLEALRHLRRKFPKRFNQTDGAALEQRVVGELAQRGDPDAARAVRSVVEADGAHADVNCDANGGGAQSADVRIAALNALTQMDAAQALPTLQKILRQRDKNSVCLRRTAVFLIAQRRIDGVETALLEAVRDDPDPEVRRQAVLHLSQFNTTQAMSALDSIVRDVKDSALVATAVTALSQSDDPRAKEALLTYAEREDTPKPVWRQVIVQLLQSPPGGPGKLSFFQRIYERLDKHDIELRRMIINHVWGSLPYGDTAAGRWYFDIARNNNEAPEIRVEALEKGAHMAPIERRMKIYTPTLDPALRARLIDAYASNEHIQQTHSAVLEDLAEIARRDPDSDLRLRALAGISASKSPHAAEVLQDIVNHP